MWVWIWGGLVRGEACPRLLGSLVILTGGKWLEDKAWILLSIVFEVVNNSKDERRGESVVKWWQKLRAELWKLKFGISKWEKNHFTLCLLPALVTRVQTRLFYRLTTALVRRRVYPTTRCVRFLSSFDVCVCLFPLTSPTSVQGTLGDGDLMLICIAPDHEGKFGFNVKVGVCPAVGHMTSAAFSYVTVWQMPSPAVGVKKNMCCFCVVVHSPLCILHTLSGWGGSENASRHIPH